MDQEGQGLQQQLHQIQRGIQAESERCRVLKVGGWGGRQPLLMSLLRAPAGGRSCARHALQPWPLLWACSLVGMAAPTLLGP